MAMITVESSRRSRIVFERFFAALIDPERCNGAMLLLLVGYAATWTLYACVARSSQDLHPDMAELISWSRDLSLGNLKHPPLAAWLVWLWFSVFPIADWSYYLLAMLMPTIALWIAWQLSADYLEIGSCTHTRPANRFTACSPVSAQPSACWRNTGRCFCSLG